MDNKEKVYLSLNEQNILSFDVFKEWEEPTIFANELTLKANTLNVKTKNTWTIISKTWKDGKIIQLKNLGVKNKFFQFATEEDTVLLNNFTRKINKWDFVLNKEYFSIGLGIFLDLDKEENEVHCYLYKFKNQQKEDLDEILKSVLWDWHCVAINQSSKFHYLEGEQFTTIEEWGYEYIQSMISQAIEKQDLDAIFSFLFGLWVANYVEVNEKWIVFQIPTVKMLFTKKQFLLETFEYLRRFFVFSVSVGSTTQIASKDGLFEDLLIKVYRNVINNPIIINKSKGLDKTTEWKKLVDNNQTKEVLKNILSLLELENPEMIDELMARKLLIHTF